MSLLDNKSFCAKLWTHLHLYSTGDVRACCVMVGDKNVGNLETNSLKEIWNSPKMMQYRKDMLEGKKINACMKCWSKEEAGTVSYRMDYNSYYKDRLDKITANTDKNGFEHNFNIISWDIRFSNKCNFKCRMCNPGASSSWVQDAIKLTDNKEEIKRLVTLENVEGKSSIDFLKENIEKVEYIYFAGGEPLLMDEHYEVLELLIKNNNFCTIAYNTNLSTLKYKKWNVLDFWKKWPKEKLWVMPSIDEIGERAELIRKGTKWEEVENNLKTLISHGVQLQPHITTSCMSVGRLPEILQYFFDNKILLNSRNYLNFTLGAVYIPNMHINVLTDEIKNQVIEKLNKFNKNFIVNTEPKTGYILKLLKQPHKPEYARQFVDYTLKLDKIRGEDTFKTIPELLPIYELYKP